jgi:hypothetical protein
MCASFNELLPPKRASSSQSYKARSRKQQTMQSANELPQQFFALQPAQTEPRWKYCRHVYCRHKAAGELESAGQPLEAERIYDFDRLVRCRL